MILDLDQGDLKTGLLGLVVALVEIIEETLRLQALRRMEAGSLTGAEIERMGEALSDIDDTLRKLKLEMGIGESVQSVRHGLDQAVDELLSSVLDPGPGASPSLVLPL